MDQITKSIALDSLSDGQIIRPFGEDNDLLWLILVRNPGSAFGVRFFPPLILKIIALLAAAGLGIYLYLNPLIPRWQSIPLSFIVGGAVGNLIDRLRFGLVTDFVSIDLPDFLMQRWPVFNVADASVSVSVTFLIILTLFGNASQKQTSDEEEKSSPE